MDFSIDITTLIQVVHILIGLYIVNRLYIKPVTMELLAEDALAEKNEEKLLLERQALENEKEKIVKEYLVRQQNLKDQVPQYIIFKEEFSIPKESEIIDHPSLNETIALLTKAIVKEVTII